MVKFTIKPIKEYFASKEKVGKLHITEDSFRFEFND